MSYYGILEACDKDKLTWRPASLAMILRGLYLDLFRHASLDRFLEDTILCGSCVREHIDNDAPWLQDGSNDNEPS